MSTPEFGTDEERTAVRDALEALAAFNKHVDFLLSLGVSTDLETKGRGFVATFTKTITILPIQRSQS